MGEGSQSEGSDRGRADRVWIRPSTPDDSAAIVALMAESGLQPHTRPEHLRWKYWESGSDWPNARSFVVTDGTALLAHTGIVWASCQWGPRHLTFIHLVDWVARRDAAGVGTFLLKRVASFGDAVLAISMTSQARQVIPLTGFRSFGVLTEFRRAIHPLAVLKGSWKPLWKVPLRFARSVIWTVTAPRMAASEWQERQVTAEDLPRVLGSLPGNKSGVTAFERSEALFRHMLVCPIARIEFYVLENNGRVGGYFLLSYVANEARLADCWIDSEDPADWRGLVLAVVRQAKRNRHVADLAAWSSQPRLSRALVECGFRARATCPILVRGKRGLAEPESALHVQMLECDGAYY